MTLGGLALAVGILVDDATVTIENINWHLEQGKDVRTAILDGARQIVGPAFVSLLCICVVFVPMFALKGVAGFLFVPMALAVVFAMIASFVLSRTFVPTLAMYLLKPHDPSHALMCWARRPSIGGGHRRRQSVRRASSVASSAGSKPGARRLPPPAGHGARPQARLHRRLPGLRPGVLPAGPDAGRNFFPNVDTGQIALHVRAPVGARIEETSAASPGVER
jgi:multidrug efflux pump subunit AcrB